MDKKRKERSDKGQRHNMTASARKTRSDKGKQRKRREYHALTLRMDQDIYEQMLGQLDGKSIMRFINDTIKKHLSNENIK